MSEELVNAAKERIADLLEDINGGVGDDVSYDETFEQIKAETDKLSAVDGDKCDWSVIAVNAEEILQDKSKDFRVACYLAACKLREGSLEKVLDAYVLIREITEKYWDTMYPPLRRIRARAGMVGWMADQGGPIVLDISLKPADGPMVKLLDDTRKEIEAMLREKFGDHYPGMSKLSDAIRHLVRTEPKEKKPEPKKPAPVAEKSAAGAAPKPAPVAASGGGGGGAGVGDFATAADVRKGL